MRPPEAIAVEHLTLVESFKSELRRKAIYRTVEYSDGAYALGSKAMLTR